MPTGKEDNLAQEAKEQCGDGKKTREEDVSMREWLIMLNAA